MATFVPLKSRMHFHEQKVHIKQVVAFFSDLFSGPSHSGTTCKLHLERDSNQAECVPAESKLLACQLKSR